jgi:predicted nucleotidyltransferase
VAGLAASNYNPRRMIQTELDVLRDVSKKLTSRGVAFMLTGSMAMNYYAQPRMTRDIDLVVEVASEQVDLLMSLFEIEYYVDRHAVAKAIAHRSMFNLIHNETIIKLDCIVLKKDQYRQQEFARRRLISLGDFETWIVSREDLILSKLYWARDSNSELQLRDVKNLLTADCDMAYLHSCADDLGVKELLLEVLRSHE